MFRLWLAACAHQAAPVHLSAAPAPLRGSRSIWASWAVRQARSADRFDWLGLDTPAANHESTIRTQIEGNCIVMTSTPTIDGLELSLDAPR